MNYCDCYPYSCTNGLPHEVYGTDCTYDPAACHPRINGEGCDCDAGSENCKVGNYSAWGQHKDGHIVFLTDFSSDLVGIAIAYRKAVKSKEFNWVCLGNRAYKCAIEYWVA